MDVRTRFEAFTERLVRGVEQDSTVEGLVLIGSTADTERVDQWSDHDFFLLVTPGREAEYRADLSWLPDHHRIVFSVRDSEHGLKVVYDDGAVLEFAVASVADAASFGGSPQRIALDRASVAEAFRAGRREPSHLDDLSHFRLFLSWTLIGVGRARRGEELDAGHLVRTYAAEHLMWLFRRHLPSAGATDDPRRAADPYNPWRRFESAHPDLGAALVDAMAQRPERCGIELLAIAETFLRPRWSEYLEDEMDAVRSALRTQEQFCLRFLSSAGFGGDPARVFDDDTGRPGWKSVRPSTGLPKPRG